jgi:hypothetical protein
VRLMDLVPMLTCFTSGSLQSASGGDLTHRCYAVPVELRVENVAPDKTVATLQQDVVQAWQ